MPGKEHLSTFSRLQRFLRNRRKTVYASQPLFYPHPGGGWAEMARVFVGPLQPTDNIGNYAHDLQDKLAGRRITPSQTTPQANWDYPGVRPVLLFDEAVGAKERTTQTSYEITDYGYRKRSKLKTNAATNTTTLERRIWLDIYPSAKEARAAYDRISAQKTKPEEDAGAEA